MAFLRHELAAMADLDVDRDIFLTKFTLRFVPLFEVKLDQ